MTQASALLMDFSQSLANRRQRPRHANVGSTTHLRGSTSKPPGAIGPLDDLARPAPEADKGSAQFRPGIAAIGEHVAQFWGLMAKPGKDPGRAIPILKVGRVDRARDQVAAGVREDVTLFGGAFDPMAGDRLTP